MNFIEAVKLLQLDKTIKLMRRGGYSSITIDIDGVFRINHWSNYKPSIDDILAEDWYVVKDEKLHTFEEALMALKSGATIKRKDYVIMHKITHYNFSFDKSDLLANDWLIIDKEETK